MRFVLLCASSLWGLALLPAQAQKTKVRAKPETHLANPVKGGVTVTSQGKALLFNNYKGSGLNFSFTFARNAQVQATDHPGLYTVNGQPLQVLAVPVADYRADSASTTLRRYVESEASYLIHNLPQPVEPFAQAGQDKQTGRLYAVWGFPLPEGYNQQVVKQVFVSFLDGDYVISLCGNQLQGQDFEQTLHLLFDTAHSYRSSEQPIVAK